ncbi:hypothetical protein [Akkermansia muciniphila]|uniref:hypothetical protein n=1 Tax=Akkermansia muciniphila TaxID=239935 RepID=UPI000F0B2461|nr:hypothetical protein [Akkermansia muciniphila]AYR28007.1 hypothetical protein CUB89_05065 [Akkermansia muciniphila]
MRQAANYNVHATESLPQSLALHFISPSGEDMDISGMTLRGAVVQDGVIMLDCAVTGASTALVTWPRLAAGCGAYDIFLTDASGKEYPLLKGSVHVVSRVTPPDGTNEAAAVAGALDVSIPETEDGSVTIVENPSIVVEELVRQAEAARDEATRLVETLEGQVESGELVNEAVANKLPGALKEAGVELAAATGQSTLSSGDAADTWTIVGGYAMTWGDEILAGHLPDSCRLKSISTVYFFTDPALNQYCLRIWKLVDGVYSLIGTSAYVSNLSSGQTATWVFTPGVTLQRGDVIIIQVCEGAEMTPYALGMHAVLTPSVPGRGLITEVVNPPTVNGTMAPLMTVVVDYDDGITLGGIELATARQLDSLGRDVRQSSATAEAAARTAGQSAAAASTAADNAATSATSAANSATAAQQALEAIPEVDASGNMTLAGGLTAAGAINANGGVNIPLAVGAPTDTGAVNRLHAAGLAGVTDIFSQHAYLNTGSITATGTAATTALIPGQYAQVRVPAGTHSTIVFPFTGPNGQHNYSNFAGFSIPWRIPGAGKITIGIGRGSKTTRSDLTQGSYSIIPGNNLAHNSGEILDITFDNVRDATRGGYVVKVREIYALSEAEGWRVKTTTSFVPATHNEPIPSIVNKIIYHQRTQYKFESEYISYGSLYLLTGGGQTVQLHKIAAVRGVNAFETGLGISSIVTDLPGNASGDVYMQVGSAVRTLYQPGNINPVYYALEALARNDIKAEETADFVDINIPL